ncbi:DegT/DnrJ/EryC1/StrS family aminotransferase [Candidatus Dojkabacteria bacterium]|uniref:DegT/DnrJ/EryC1/StrS family aminotransferase n=1 Tax=Candidatus Dojkabacteria bacterium TaxID=2099670 RepID=A0A955L7J6_9BACT|nr:DegT/DnrJ/EryC1/StrS family aminotransferase [Candidatus Dojkabacteria bacterium]
MNYPIIDLKKEYASIKPDIDKAITSVISETAFVGGKFVEEFEDEIKNFTGASYAIGLNSGTDALYLSLWAAGIGPGDEVITTPFTFFATAEVIAHIGATPVFIDIDPDTFNIDASQIEQAITKNTKAILPVHLYGYAANMTEIISIAQSYNLFVLEDACQAIGAYHDSAHVGLLGNAGTLSFYPSKNLGAYGDGGMVITNDEKLAREIRRLRNHGQTKKYFPEKIGVSSRLDGIQAAILSAKLKHLPEWTAKRIQTATWYDELLNNQDGIKLPAYQITDRKNHVYHQYTLRVLDGMRDKLQKHLENHRIGTMIYYPQNLHQTKAFETVNFVKHTTSESEKASLEVLSLPMHPFLERSDVENIVGIINDCLN